MQLRANMYGSSVFLETRVCPGRQTLYKCLTNNLKYEHKSFNEGKVGHGLLQNF